jgi:hypothetical protein
MTRAEQKLKALQEQYEKQQAQTLQEERILEHVEPLAVGYVEPRIIFSKLYGTAGLVNFKHRGRYRLSTDKGQEPNAKLLKTLLERFPPVPYMKVKDGGCLSFRPDIEENNVDAESHNADVYDCYGVTLKVQTFQEQTIRFQWASELDGELWRFDIEVPFHQTDVGRLEIRARYYGGHASGKIASYEQCELYPKLELDAQCIRWASGGPEYPNSFTVFWDRDSGARIDFPGLFRRQEAAQ